ncbi:DUF3785 family protein [Candidatus Clostridium radicumherbarum]|uniref:DUF3785 family protein n=1 Tax=Candidatus Clostridium radicumherbarum TaxID=3381662 RepID=A0ABW8TNF8_9CLOT
MKSYKFQFNDKTYELKEDNLDYIANDEAQPVEGIDRDLIFALLNETDEVNFDVEYYDNPCENCFAGKKEKAKFFRFLEYHFFIFTNKGEYIISNISNEFKNTTASQLFKSNKADNSFIVSIAVCENCGHYSIEIDQCDI